MTKQDILRALEDLPEDATVEDAIDPSFIYMYKVERGIKDAVAGRKVSQEEAKRMLLQPPTSQGRLRSPRRERG